MGQPAPTEITTMGAKYLENWLNQNGYTDVEIDSWQQGSVDIKATGTVENIIVQVRTVQLPDEHQPTSGTDKFALKEIAERSERVPYSAFITMDENKEIVGEIIWERVH
jgi:hypothetical protein